MSKPLFCIPLVCLIFLGYAAVLHTESNKSGGLSPELIGGVALVLIVAAAMSAIPSKQSGEEVRR